MNYKKKYLKYKKKYLKLKDLIDGGTKRKDRAPLQRWTSDNDPKPEPERKRIKVLKRWASREEFKPPINLGRVESIPNEEEYCYTRFLDYFNSRPDVNPRLIEDNINLTKFFDKISGTLNIYLEKKQISERVYWVYRIENDMVIIKPNGLYFHFKIKRSNIYDIKNESSKIYECYLTMHKINETKDPNKIHVTIKNYFKNKKKNKSDLRLHFGIKMTSVVSEEIRSFNILSFEYLGDRTTKINDPLKDQLITVIIESLNNKIRQHLNNYVVLLNSGVIIK